MSKIISGSQTGSDSRMQVISRADFQPGALGRDVAETSLAARGDLFPFEPGKY
jgi:hypothetical protein